MNLENEKIIVVMGSGGIGKTTTAAALSLWLARKGKKVLVLTIDPSQRLAQALGISADGKISKVPGADCELYAAVLNSKQVFDEFILKATKKIPAAESLFKNKLYQQLSTTLSGSQEFTAIERLYEVSSSGEFDVIVLDTPPSKHAMDFLKSPEKMASLFQEKITKWFVEPQKGSLRGLLQAGTKKVFKILENLTGSEFVENLGDFFSKIANWQVQLRERSVEVQRLLTSPETSFVLVTGMDQAKIKEAEHLYKEIFKGGHQFKGVLINRSLPLWMKPQLLSETPNVQDDLFLKVVRYHKERDVIYENFAKLLPPGVFVKRLPEFDTDLNGLADLHQLFPFFEGD